MHEMKTLEIRELSFFLLYSAILALIFLDDFRGPIGASCVRAICLQNHLFFMAFCL